VRSEPHRTARIDSLLLFSLAPPNPLSRLVRHPKSRDRGQITTVLRQRSGKIKNPGTHSPGVLSGPDCHDGTNPRGCALSLSCRSAWLMTFLPQWKSFELQPTNRTSPKILRGTFRSLRFRRCDRHADRDWEAKLRAHTTTSTAGCYQRLGETLGTSTVNRMSLPCRGVGPTAPYERRK
jgi:hypothetical protein